MAIATSEVISFAGMGFEIQRAQEMDHTMFIASHVGSLAFFELAPDQTATIYQNTSTLVMPVLATYEVLAGLQLEGVKRRHFFTSKYVECTAEDVRPRDRLVLADDAGNQWTSKSLTTVLCRP